jgi:hypothetical protein
VIGRTVDLPPALSRVLERDVRVNDIAPELAALAASLDTGGTGIRLTR